MPELHYRDATAARKAKELHYHDGTAVRNIKEAWYHDGTAVRKVFSGAAVVNPLVLPDVVYGALSSSGVSVWVNFYSDGTVQGFVHNNVVVWTRNWFAPTEAGIGAGYWLRATKISGSASVPTGDTLDTWLQLSGVRGWTVTAPSGGSIQTRDCTLQIQVATDSAGANIVASGTIYLEASRES
ncbi:MAG: hypothetical protein ACOZJZ_12685 [Pseudomonadota bacterium]